MSNTRIRRWGPSEPRTGALKVDASLPVLVPVTMHWLWAPLGLLVVLPLPALVGSLAIPDARYLSLFGQPSFLTEDLRLTVLAYMSILLVIFAVVVPMRGEARAFIELDKRAMAWLGRTVRTLAAITIFAYLTWMANALVNGLGWADIVALLSGDAGAGFTLRGEYFTNLGGVTTWMQLGALAAPLAILRARAGGTRATKVLVTLIALAAVRAFLNSERLALIELMLSVILATLILRPRAPSLLRRPLASVFLIAAAIGALVVIFAAFEFFRSWTYAQSSFEGGFWLYVTTLLLGYYATALNLAAFDAGLLNETSLPSALFQGNFYEQIFGPSPIAGAQRAYGLETFTNRSGLVVPDIAFGAVGGGVVIAIAAAFIAILARRTARGHVVAFALYCASAVAVLEIVRIFYLGSSRFLPLIIAAALMSISWVLMSGRTRAQMGGNDRVLPVERRHDRALRMKG